MDRWDLFILAGVLLALAGLWQIYLPAALIAAGGFLVLFGIEGQKAWVRSRQSREVSSSDESAAP